MEIVIPSRQRSHLIQERTLKLIPSAIVSVDEREVDDYRPICPNLRTHPPLETLAEIYNWCVQSSPDEVVIVCDDDITGVRCFTGDNVRMYRDPAAVLQILENAAETAKGIGARLFGFTNTENPQHYNPLDPFTFVFNPYVVCGYIGKEVKSDPKRRLWRDVDTALTELLKNRILFCDKRFMFDSVAPVRQSGGNAINRSRDDMAAATNSMISKWGHYVKTGDRGDTVMNRAALQRRQK